MLIFDLLKNIFAFSKREKSRPTDKWEDPWLDPGVIYEGKQPDLADCQRRNSFAHGKCPHCGQKELREGPSGPGAVNFLCAACGSKFNEMGIFGVDLLRDCTNPIPELNIDATHDHFGPIIQAQNENLPPPGGRRAAILATKEKHR
jgi:hypothetical protein